VSEPRLDLPNIDAAPFQSPDQGQALVKRARREAN
jgi:hypothetical protein